ncbi:MAG: ribonuclease HII [Tissierellia bacterium]|nr:ribonuclease HII [Tissierellia bacterium]
MDRKFEIEMENKGYNIIAGVDEVGRGCLFGDVVACAIVMPDKVIEGVMDSKKLTPKKRDALYEEILEKALAIGIGRVSPDIIDKINIKEATKLAMAKAVEYLRDPQGEVVKPDFVFIDAETIPINIEQKGLKHGDDICYSIACASIVAKVFRDRLCLKWESEYPGYGIERHKGYGTKLHRQALLTKGVTNLHRKTFLKKILGSTNEK